MSTTTNVDRESITAEARDEWQRDPQLRAEFCHDIDTYIAFRIADAAGLARVFGEPRKERR